MKFTTKNGLDGGTPFMTKLMLVGVFLIMTVSCGYAMSETLEFADKLQRYAYSIGFSALLSGLVVALLYTMQPKVRYRTPKHSAWFYPLLAGGLALVAMSLSYIWMGVWPFGIESVMIVDMHHQYGPLLAYLRDVVRNGGNLLYTFETGVGANFISMFAYYLASPFNLLLALLPESLLTEGILLITLLKNALSAAFFAACVQYVFRRRDLSVAMLSLGYSLSMYMIAYSWNIMWLDGVMVLPLAVLGFERMMREGKYGVYILSLGYILFTNYYIGFMACVFLVVYFVMFLLREKRGGGEIGRAVLRFGIGSLIGGGLAMCILLPVVFALGYTSAAGETLPEIASTFELFKIPAQQLFGMVPTIRSGNLPNIYCGILPVVLIPLFITTKTIPLRRRLAYSGLLAVMALSCTVNLADLAWHGLHTPNDLPYRFSFLYVFAALMVAAAMLPHLQEITRKQIGGTFACIAGYVVLFEMWQADGTNVFTPVYVTLLLAAIYCGILLLVSNRKLAQRTGYMLLALVFTIEMTVHGGFGLVALNGNEYYTDRENYVANAEHEANAAAVDKMVAIVEKETDGGFYRAELLPRRTCVDTALYRYKGLTSFASSNYYHTTRLLGAMGYADNGVNSYLYHSFVPLCDSLLGMQYLTIQTYLGEHPYLEYVDSITTRGYTHYIYRNKLALPIAYRVSDRIHNFEMQQYNPFGTQEDMLSAMTEDGLPLYSYLPITVDPVSTDIATAYNQTRFTVNGNGNAAWFDATVNETGTYYGFVDCTAAESASISVYDQNGNLLDTWDASTNEPYIIDMGTLDKDYTVEVSVTATYAVTGNVYIAKLDTELMETKLQSLASEGLQVETFTDNHIKGSVTATKDGAMFTTIPYDAAWQVTVDGKAVKTYPIGDLSEDGSKGAFLAFDITEGEHKVEMTFIPKGLLPGLLATAISLIALIILLIVTRTKKVMPEAPTPSEPTPYVPKKAEEPPKTELDDNVTLTDLLQDPADEAEQPEPPKMREFKPEDFQL